MPGAGRSTSPMVRAFGALVALTAIIGYVLFGWSFNGSIDPISIGIGISVAVTAVGLAVYERVSAGGE